MGFGVADGVYQWREKGIDAGEFSRLLMHTALEAVEAGQPDVLKGEDTSLHTCIDNSGHLCLWIEHELFCNGVHRAAVMLNHS